MIIHNAKITNFKSIYGTQEFNFDDLTGLVKLSGPIGSGKTAICEALQWGLLGTVKGQTNPSLVSWNADYCEVELNITSKNREIRIVRNIREPLVVEIDGRQMAASNKRNTQTILEEDIYDVPKLAILKMCLISFNGFGSLADMTPYETKQFIDEIFGFKLFSDYNEIISEEKKTVQNNIIKLTALHEENQKQVESLMLKKEMQQTEMLSSIDIDKYNKDRADLIEQGKQTKQQYNDLDEEYKSKEAALNDDISKFNEKIAEEETNIRQKYSEQISDIRVDADSKILAVNVTRDELNDERSGLVEEKSKYMTLGKQEKEWYAKFKEGVCPTCGHDIDSSEIEKHKEKMYEYAELYKETTTKIDDIDNKLSDCSKQITDIKAECSKKVNEVNEACDKEVSEYRAANKTELERLQGILNKCNEEHRSELAALMSTMNSLKTKIYAIDNEINKFNESLKTMNENYDGLIEEHQNKIIEIGHELENCDIEIEEWNEMSELLTKTLRYKLLNTLIPHINKSIRYFIDRLDQPYRIEYDQEFHAHIYTDSFDREISYNNLSTGQKKTVDIAIVFGILQNVIANVDMNVLVMDELMSNMDSDARNVMLSVLKESMGEDKCIFIVNHAEMNDDYFDHKIRVGLTNTKVTVQQKKRDVPTQVTVRASKYETIF